MTITQRCTSFLSVCEEKLVRRNILKEREITRKWQKYKGREKGE
jgi:hypothetical protein